MKEFNVAYQAGVSRSNAGVCVDWMLAEIDGIELYAEAENTTWNDETERYADESATYDELKAAIMEQAQQNGIDVKTLRFWYDKEDGGETMNTAKIYGITCYQAPQMAATGSRFSLEPWGNNTRDYQGEDDGGVDYILPEGYHVAEDNIGVKHIYPINENYPCEIIESKDGIPTITAVTYPGYITLKKA